MARRAAMASALAASVLTFVPQASYAASRPFPLGIVARDYSFQGVPSRLPAGSYDIRFFNIGDEFHVFVAVNLGPVCSATITTKEAALEFLAAVEDQDPETLCPGSSLAADAAAPPGGRSSALMTLTPGRMLYFCPVPDEDGTPHAELGMIGFTNVFGLPGGFGS